MRTPEDITHTREPIAVPPTVKGPMLAIAFRSCADRMRKAGPRLGAERLVELQQTAGGLIAEASRAGLFAHSHEHAQPIAELVTYHTSQADPGETGGRECTPLRSLANLFGDVIGGHTITVLNQRTMKPQGGLWGGLLPRLTHGGRFGDIGWPPSSLEDFSRQQLERMAAGCEYLADLIEAGDRSRSERNHAQHSLTQETMVGPQDPELFVNGTKRVKVQPIPFRILAHMWSRQSKPEPIESLTEHVWSGGDEPTDAAIKAALRKLNACLSKADYHRFLHQKSGSVYWD